MAAYTYPPLYQLKAVDDNIWIVDGDLIHMSAAGLKVPFPTRMTVIRLNNGDIWLHSPIHFHEQLAEAIQELGPISHLVSPNLLHYAYIADWKKHFPQAIAWRSPGVEKRAKSQGIVTNFDANLEDKAAEPWSEEIDQLIFQGGRLVQEVVFFHRQSQTLILTDLIENFEAEKVPSPFWRCVHRIAQIAAPHGSTPIDYRMTFVGNKELARQSLRQIYAWEPHRIIIAHGAWIENNAQERLRQAFAWLEH